MLIIAALCGHWYSLGGGVVLQTAPEERAAAEAGGGAVVDVPRRALPADLTQRTMVSTFSILLIECIIITLMQITLNLERRLYFSTTCTALNLRVWRDPKYCVFITAYSAHCTTAHPF